MFFALKGENFNGNKFAEQALEKGATFVVIDEQEFESGNDTLLVDDVLLSLQELSRYHRRKFSIPFIGLTGSNGKTTNKELIHEVLRTTHKVTATRGNLNNHIGVPLTLLSISDETEIAIIEMGANHQGEIKMLSELAEPTHGMITNIGKAHLEGFGGVEGIKKGKKELFDFIANHGGLAFVNASDPVVVKLSEEVESRVFFQGDEPGQVKGRVTNESPYVEFEWSEGDYRSGVVSSKLIGTYNINNFLAAICIGRYFDVEPQLINNAISSYTPGNKRSQLKKSDRNLLYLDHYNANPTSTEAAIRHFARQPEKDKLVILGDMLELGEDTALEHHKILELLREKNLPAILVGPAFREAALQFETSMFRSFNKVEDACEYIREHPVEGHSVLLKGSRGIRLEDLEELL